MSVLSQYCIPYSRYKNWIKKNHNNIDDDDDDDGDDDVDDDNTSDDENNSVQKHVLNFISKSSLHLNSLDFFKFCKHYTNL